MGLIDVYYANEADDLGVFIDHLIFNQGATGSRPVRSTKLNRPPLPGSFEENQGVKTLGQPTP